MIFPSPPLSVLWIFPQIQAKLHIYAQQYQQWQTKVFVQSKEKYFYDQSRSFCIIKTKLFVQSKLKYLCDQKRSICMIKAEVLQLKQKYFFNQHIFMSVISPLCCVESLEMRLFTFPTWIHIKCNCISTNKHKYLLSQKYLSTWPGQKLKTFQAFQEFKCFGLNALQWVHLPLCGHFTCICIEWRIPNTDGATFLFCRNRVTSWFYAGLN